MSDLIQKLKYNGYPFGLMSQEMQDEARWYRTYRPDYQEEPEIVECEVKKDIDSGNLYCEYQGCQPDIDTVISSPDFIGFKYKDGFITPLSRRYEFEGDMTEVMLFSEVIDAKVLTPTHVLFRKEK